jgi:hypothetical protein
MLDSVTANIAPYPGYYELLDNFMKPNAAYRAKADSTGHEIHLLISPPKPVIPTGVDEPAVSLSDSTRAAEL